MLQFALKLLLMIILQVGHIVVEETVENVQSAFSSQSCYNSESYSGV